MQPHRAVHCGDQRNLDVENVHEDFSALALDFVVALRGEEVETFRTDCPHKGVAAAGAVGGADGVKVADAVASHTMLAPTYHS